MSSTFELNAGLHSGQVTVTRYAGPVREPVNLSRTRFQISAEDNSVSLSMEQWEALCKWICERYSDGLYSPYRRPVGPGQAAREVVWHPDLGLVDSAPLVRNGPRCAVCGCTDNDCSQCIERTGERCSWVAPDLCSACVVSGFSITAREEGGPAS